MQMTTTPDPRMLGDYWMINYDAQRALQSFRFLKLLLGNPPRVYVSGDCAAIITSNLPLKLIREPHVREWQDSFRELSAEEFVRRVAEIVNGKRKHILN
ncbi:MAG: hypothetical protein R3270_11770 [Gammaproteobacteria bacterium]|nr:hypothetical protein [Gammaproteobacteria bacterium]